MTMHTPGPWVLTRLTQHEHAVSAESWERLARVATRFMGDYQDDEEGMANARLIAAAPELLEACKAALSDDQPYIEKCRAAIAKAEGVHP